ncbi:MAG: SDR family NAD(P)-dependent oxidoreductase [Ignavibacteriaceae bacterium]|nr:SDR family NAD(P)-dependent oxidoreductase [Ignavibacteriaceae bacterium]
MNLETKTILITGASSGIGYEMAKQFAAANCNLILLARRKDKLDELAQELKSESKTIFTYKCDVSKKEEVEFVFREIRTKISHIDIAILNSGIGHNITVENFDSKFADETFGVNVLGIIYCIGELLKDFLPRKEGIIVGVSSIADVRGFPKSGIYAASKAAASTLLESFRVELIPHNIKVITVRPGWVTTPMIKKNDFKMPFLMSAEKAAEIIISGIKKEKKVIEFPIGTVIGGKIIKVLPNFIFDYLASKGLPQKETSA